MKEEYQEQNKNVKDTIKMSKKPVKQKRAPGQKLVGLICPLCGREFGTMSLKFHLKSCKQKFDLTPKSLPPNKRRNADKNLANYEAYKNKGISSGGNYNMDQLNQ